MFVFPFAKGDLYVTIADTLKTDLYIQTWRSNPKDLNKHPLNETNNGYKLDTIMSVKTAAGEWQHGCDHSKWCVSDSNSKGWMCVGDSNREPSQFKRPGGALCINSKPVADAFREIKNHAVLVPDCESDSDSDSDTDSDTDNDTDSDSDPGPRKRPKVDG